MMENLLEPLLLCRHSLIIFFVQGIYLQKYAHSGSALNKPLLFQRWREHRWSCENGSMRVQLFLSLSLEIEVDSMVDLERARTFLDQDDVDS